MNEATKQLFRECWEQDLLPSDLGYPEWDFAYLSGRDWFTWRGYVCFFD